MKTLFSFLSVFIFCLCATAQQKATFKEIGKKQNLFSLSNGRFDEQFLNDPIQQVGSVEIDVATGKIKRLLPKDSVGSAAEDMIAATRFLSVDPLTGKYPELTPYQYASNRPIDGIDLDGLEYLTYTTNLDIGFYPPKITNQSYTWYNANQHNAHGNLGQGILYKINFYKNGEALNPSIYKSRTQFVERGMKIMKAIPGDYGNYMGPTSLYQVSNWALETPFFTSDYDYDIPPVDFIDFTTMQHDLRYDKLGAIGENSLKNDWGTTKTDIASYNSWNDFLKTNMVGMPDPYNGQPVTSGEVWAARRGSLAFFATTFGKVSGILNFMSDNYNNEVKQYTGPGASQQILDLFYDKYLKKDNEGDWIRNRRMWNQDENGSYTPKKPSEINSN